MKYRLNKSKCVCITSKNKAFIVKVGSPEGIIVLEGEVAVAVFHSLINGSSIKRIVDELDKSFGGRRSKKLNDVRSIVKRLEREKVLSRK